MATVQKLSKVLSLYEVWNSVSFLNCRFSVLLFLVPIFLYTVMFCYLRKCQLYKKCSSALTFLAVKMWSEFLTEDVRLPPFSLSCLLNPSFGSAPVPLCVFPYKQLTVQFWRVLSSRQLISWNDRFLRCNAVLSLRFVPAPYKVLKKKVSFSWRWRQQVSPKCRHIYIYISRTGQNWIVSCLYENTHKDIQAEWQVIWRVLPV